MIINSENKSMDMEMRDFNYILPAYVRSYLFHTKNEMPSKIIFPMFPSVKIVEANAKVTEIPIEYVPPLDAIAAEISEDGSNVAEVTPAQEAELDRKDDEIERLKTEVESLTQTERGGEVLGGKEPTEPETVIPDAPEEAAKKAADIGLKRLEEMSIDEPVSPAKAAFAELAGESVHETEKKRYEKKEKQMKGMSAAFKVDPDPAHQPPPDRKPNQPPGGDIGPGAGPSNMQARDRKDQTRVAKDLVDEPEIDESKEEKFDKTVSRDEEGKPVVGDKEKD